MFCTRILKYFMLILFAVSFFCGLTTASAQVFNDPYFHSKPIKIKKKKKNGARRKEVSRKDEALRPYREKVKKISEMLLRNSKYDFQIKVEFGYIFNYSNIEFYDNICHVYVATKQVEREIQTEAGLAGMLAHELCHCLQHSEGRAYYKLSTPFLGHGHRVPEREIDAEDCGGNLLLSSGVYALRARRIVLGRRVKEAEQKELAYETISEYKERFLVFLRKEKESSNQVDKNNAEYFVFKPDGFQKFRHALAKWAENKDK